MLPRVRQAQPLRSPACSPARPRTARPYRWEGGIASAASPYFGGPPLLAHGTDEGAVPGVRGADWGGAARLNAARKCVSPLLPDPSPQTALGDRHGDGGGEGCMRTPLPLAGCPAPGGHAQVALPRSPRGAAALRAVGVRFGAVRVCGVGIPGVVLSPGVGRYVRGGVAAAAAGTAGRRAHSWREGRQRFLTSLFYKRERSAVIYFLAVWAAKPKRSILLVLLIY